MRDPLWDVEFEHERRMSEIKGRSFGERWERISDDPAMVGVRKLYMKVEEEPMKRTKVWEVWAFCGEDPDNITTIPSGSPFTFADDEAEAILKSRICEMIAGYAKLDFKFITIIATEIGCIKVGDSRAK